MRRHVVRNLEAQLAQLAALGELLWVQLAAAVCVTDFEVACEALQAVGATFLQLPVRRLHMVGRHSACMASEQRSMGHKHGEQGRTCARKKSRRLDMCAGGRKAMRHAGGRRRGVA